MEDLWGCFFFSFVFLIQVNGRLPSFNHFLHELIDMDEPLTVFFCVCGEKNETRKLQHQDDEDVWENNMSTEPARCIQLVFTNHHVVI